MRRIAALVIALLFLIGMAARLAPWRLVFPAAGRVELVPTDTFYYLRFAQLQLAHLGHFVHFDPFVNFPWGAEIEWPPLHTALVALMLRVAGAGKAELATAWTCPSVAAVELALFAVLAWRRLGPLRAVLAVGVLALTPAIVEMQQLGTADHHVHEPMFAAALVLLFAEALEGNRRAAIGSGVLLALARLLTPSGLLLIPVVGASGLLAALCVPRERAAAVGRALSWAGGVAAAILGVAVLAWGLPGSLEYECLSAFLPLFVLASTLAPAAIALARVRVEVEPTSAPTADDGGVVDTNITPALKPRSSALIAAAVALAAGSPLLPPLARALRHFAHRDPMLRAVDELTPLWRDPRWAHALLGPLLLFAPLLLVGGTRALFRDRRAGRTVALMGTALLALAAAQQARFAPMFAGAAAVLIARELPDVLGLQPPRLQRLAWAAIGVLSLPLLGGVVPPRSLGPHQAVLDRARPVLEWLRTHTPPVGDPLDVSAHPPYAIAASYQFGHLLTWWAKRPAIATPFALVPWHDRANAALARLLSETDDEAAFAQARALGARYVLATPLTWQPGERPADPERTLAARLFHDAGMAGAKGPATAHFRLIHQARDDDPATHLPFARVFEVVPGARLVGQAAPNARVTATLRLRPGSGATLEYRRETVADASGHFALVVAYPSAAPTPSPRSGRDPADVAPLWPYRLEADGETALARVSEADVEGGEVVTAVFSGTGAALPTDAPPR